MLEVFGTLMYCIGNYIPTKIHTYLDPHLREIGWLSGSYGMVAWWVYRKYNQDNLVLREHMGIFIKPISIQNIPRNIVSNSIWISQFGYQTKNIWSKHLLNVKQTIPE